MSTVLVKLAPEPTPRRDAYLACAIEVTDTHIRVRRQDWQRIKLGGPRDPVRKPCVHLQAATGERVLCRTCQGTVALKVFGCTRHGKALLGRTADGYPSCATCGDYQARSEA